MIVLTDVFKFYVHSVKVIHTVTRTNKLSNTTLVYVSVK
jgi:hypothetical protein